MQGRGEGNAKYERKAIISFMILTNTYESNPKTTVSKRFCKIHVPKGVSFNFWGRLYPG